MITIARPFQVLMLFLFVMLIAAAATTGCGDAIEGTATAQALAMGVPMPPSVPDPSLNPPAGNRIAFELEATGTQDYACATSATGPVWSFVFPEAVLTRGGRMQGVHYFGPTWEALDLSAVVGQKVAEFKPDQTAIPWLLLSAKSHAGDGRMARVTFIQRLNTVGGIAPAATACDAAHLGTVTRVPYTATYAFYVASNRAHGN